MVWLSVNPACENFQTVSTALAIGSDPENYLQTMSLFLEKGEGIDPILLAEYYNNAESLGLDIFSVKRKPADPDLDAIWAEHEDFFQVLNDAAALDIASFGRLYYGRANRLLKTYIPSTKSYDEDLLG